MARNVDSPYFTGIHGYIGKGLVVKRYKYGEVISRKPDMSKVKPSAAQKSKRGRFADAVFFAKWVMKDPKRIVEYKTRLKKGQDLYHALISRYMKTGRLTNVQIKAKREVAW